MRNRFDRPIRSWSVFVAIGLAVLQLAGGCTTTGSSPRPGDADAAPVSAERSPDGRNPLLDSLARQDPQAAATLEATLRDIAKAPENGWRLRGGGAACPMPPEIKGNPLFQQAWQANPGRAMEAFSAAGIRFPQMPPRPPTCQ